jgi:ParB family transcriptional regulator, chromosome partitioning protein
MSKRTDAIKSLFSQPPQPLSADNIAPVAPRMPAGTVRSLKDSFSGIERENEELRAKFAAGELIVELAADLIDPSPVSDRFVGDGDQSFETLKQSIRDNGQEIPVVVRDHPSAAGRYQTAFGHRRIRAARELGRPVRAIVRRLSDDELVIAQGVENSAREDLTFIERAMFAAGIEDSGRSRAVIQKALSIDRAETSKLIAVARAMPADVVRSIGRAPRVGRGRWQELAAALADASAVKRARAATTSEAFSALDSDGRFVRALAAAKHRETLNRTPRSTTNLVRNSGEPLAQLARSEREVRLTIDRAAHGAFAEYLAGRLPDLFDEFIAKSEEPALVRGPMQDDNEKRT